MSYEAGVKDRGRHLTHTHNMESLAQNIVSLTESLKETLGELSIDTFGKNCMDIL